MRNTLALFAVTLALLMACSSDASRYQGARSAGRIQAEREFAAGTAEMILMCGTIAPGPCSSVEEELAGHAFADGYNARLDELRAVAEGETRLR